MIGLPHRIDDLPLPPGDWRIVIHEGGRRAVIVTCPVCGGDNELASHIIHASGLVEPGVECFNSCGFVEEVALIGWEPQSSIHKGRNLR